MRTLADFRARGSVLVALVCLTVSAAVAALAVFIFSPMRYARLALIDDHEILRYLGPDGTIAIGDIPSILFSETEVGQWGELTRLRPVYYLLRIIESALFGDDGGQWYLARMAMLAFVGVGFALVAFRAIYRKGDPASRLLLAGGFALLIGVLVVSLPSWMDIASRLGPSEIYLGCGVAVFLLAGQQVWRRPASVAGWLFLLASFILIVGSKENGLLFVLPLAGLFLLRFGGAVHRKTVLVAATVATVFVGYLVVGIGLGASGTGEDMYGNGRSIALFLAVLPRNVLAWAGLILLLLAFACEFVARRRASLPWFPEAEPGPRRTLASILKRITAALEAYPSTTVALAALLMGIGDTFFYQNYLEDSGGYSPARYGFLTELSVVVGVIAALTAILALHAARPLLAWGLSLLLIGSVLVSPIGRGVVEAVAKRDALRDMASSSTTVSDQIRGGVIDIQRNPGSQVMFLLDESSDYEPSFALARYLKYYAQVDGVLLSVTIPDDHDAEISRALAEELERLALEGRSDAGWMVLPADQRDDSTYLICFAFHDSPSSAQCDSTHAMGYR